MVPFFVVLSLVSYVACSLESNLSHSGNLTLESNILHSRNLTRNKTPLNFTPRRNVVYKKPNRKLKQTNLKSRSSIFTIAEDKRTKARMNNALLFGIPEEHNEDLRPIVEVIGKRMGIEFPLDDIDNMYRYNSNKEPRPILIRFKNNDVKGKWIIMYRRSRLWTEDVLFQEHLSAATMQIVVGTREWAREKNYPHVWTWNNDVFYRKTNNPLRYRVMNLGHLHRLKMNETCAEMLDKQQQDYE